MTDKGPGNPQRSPALASLDSSGDFSLSLGMTVKLGMTELAGIVIPDIPDLMRNPGADWIEAHF